MDTVINVQLQLKIQLNTLIYFAGNTCLTSELRKIIQLVLERLDYDVAVNGNYAGPKN